MSHPFQGEVDLCRAVGIDVARFDLMDVYMLSGHIQRELGRSKVSDLTAAQRAGLRDRAIAALPPIIKRGK